MREFFKRTVLIISGIVISAIMLEVVLQMAGLGYAAWKGYMNRGFSPAPSDKGAYRILCLGESTTDGQWPYPLEKMLNDKSIGIRFEVIDKGKGGTTTDFIVLGLEQNLDRYKPDMVIAMMGINDYNKDFVYEIAGAPLYKRSRIYRLIRILRARITGRLAESPQGKELKHIEGNDMGIKEIGTKENPQSEHEYMELGNLYWQRREYEESERMYR